MARKTVYTKEMILNSAIEIFKREGFDAVTAKNIAKELNCSVAPIYSVYLSLNDLKKDLSNHIESCLICETRLENGKCSKSCDEINSLLDKMLSKLTSNRNSSNVDMILKVREFKENLLKGENRSNIFLQFSELVSLFLKSGSQKVSRMQTLELIAKHKKYITEFKKGNK